MMVLNMVLRERSGNDETVAMKKMVETLAR